MPVAGYRIPDAAVNMRETSSMRTSACGTRISVLTFRATRNSPTGKRLTSLPPHLIVLPPNDPTLPIPPSLLIFLLLLVILVLVLVEVLVLRGDRESGKHPRPRRAPAPTAEIGRAHV